MEIHHKYVEMLIFYSTAFIPFNESTRYTFLKNLQKQDTSHQEYKDDIISDII